MKEHTAATLATIYLINIDTIPEPQLTSLYAHLSDSEKTRYQRFMLPQRQRQFVVGRILLRWSLARLLNVPFTAIELDEQERRAPLLRLPLPDATPGFSISHSGNWVACAVAATALLGLDIEIKNSQRNLASIAEHSFRPEDLTWLHAQPDPVASFYHLWSSKEARFKLTQGYAVAAIEHCYAPPHPLLSVVLMSDRPLDVAPDFISLDWSNLAD